MGDTASKDNKPTKGGVLLVDSDPTSQAQVSADLTQSGFSVVTANDGNHGLRSLESKFSRQLPVIIIVDIIMPTMSGFEFTRRFREKYPNKQIPILLMGKYKSPEDELEVHNAGAQGIVIKPISASKVLQFMDQLEMKKMKSKIADMVFDINYE